MELAIDSKREGSRVTLSVHGEVDVSCADVLRDAIDRALSADATGVVCDLADVPYIDSTGIGVLVGAAHRASEANVTLEVARPQHNVSRVLALLGVGAELNVRDAQ